MEESRFETLLRKAGQQTTRRETLVALAGGALLLNDRGEIEATKKAERRKKRRRHERAHGALIRDISILVDNSASSKPVTINYGVTSLTSCCKYIHDGIVPERAAHTFKRNYNSGWVFLNNRFWFQFRNGLLVDPYANVAVYGKFSGRGALCCNVIPNGLTVAEEASFGVNETRSWRMGESQTLISVTRRPNSRDFIHFAITLPPDLPSGP